jgi:hypothetical protein
MSEQRLTQIAELQNSIANAQRILTIQEDAFINGQSFTHSDYTLGVATAAVIDYMFDPTACSCDQIIAEVPVFNATAGPVTIEFYSDPTTTANGTELLSFNRRSSGVPAEAKLYVAPTISSVGTRFSGLLLPATAAVQGNTGDQTVQGLPFEVDKTKKMLIRVTNNNGDGVDIGRRFDWIEA